MRALNTFILFVVSMLIFNAFYAQKQLKVNGELELEGAEPLNEITVIVIEGKEVVKNGEVSSKGVFNLLLDIQKNYSLVIEHPKYVKEQIEVNTYIDDEVPKKIWPVFLKIKLKRKASEKTQNILSQIVFDTTLNRFDHKISNSPYEVQQSIFSGGVVKSDSVKKSGGDVISYQMDEEQQGSLTNSEETTTKNQLTQEASNEIEYLDPEEEKLMQDIEDKQLKSKSIRDIVETYQKSKLNEINDVKKQNVLSEEIMKRLELKHQDVYQWNEYLIDILLEKEYENKSRLEMANKKRRLVEEIAETKRHIKIMEDGFSIKE